MLTMAMAAGLVLVPDATVDARTVRAGELVRTTDGQRLTGAEAGRAVLRLPAGRGAVLLPAAALAALVGRRLPGHSVAGRGTVTLRLRPRDAARPGCWISRRALQAGEAVTERDVAPAACGGVPGRVVSAGADRVPIAATDLPAGAPLGRLLPAIAGRVASGTPLALRAAVGPVVIERAVTTMQPGRSGRRVFVRDGEGHVFPAPLALVEDAR